MLEICFSNISKAYDPGLFKKKVQAVSNLSFDVRQGEVFGLIGPNGAGKSTTIRMLLGLIRPDSGSILFRGRPLRETPIHRDIGYLPENPYLYDHLNLLELLTFCGRTSGLDAKAIFERGQGLMTKLNLLNAQKRPLRTFSKGMLQRAGICFALLHNPSIVVLDEPMSGLDPIGRKMVFDLVMELKGEGKTIFFCSHILNDVERLSDRIGLINRGRLVRLFEGTDFSRNDDKTVVLRISELDATQRHELQMMGGRLRQEGVELLLAVPEGSYYPINRYLEKQEIAVLGGRSEWVSLEEMFMGIVKEEAA